MKPILNREYKDRRAFERDAEKLFKKGYTPTQVNTIPGTVLWGHSILKWATVAGILFGPSRKADKITVTYTLHVAPATAPSFIGSR